MSFKKMFKKVAKAVSPAYAATKGKGLSPAYELAKAAKSDKGGSFLKKVAGAVSPAYGIATGEGAMGKASRKGVFGAAARALTKEFGGKRRALSEEEEKAMQEAAKKAMSTMGGNVATAKMAKGGEALSPAEKKERARMLQEVQDAKDAKKQEKAYNDSLTSPEMVMPKKPAPKKPATPVQSRAMGGMMNKKGYAAGGVVKARGMGAATRGGKCKMS
jgi:hypothetical protein